MYILILGDIIFNFNQNIGALIAYNAFNGVVLLEHLANARFANRGYAVSTMVCKVPRMGQSRGRGELPPMLS